MRRAPIVFVLSGCFYNGNDLFFSSVIRVRYCRLFTEITVENTDSHTKQERVSEALEVEPL